MAKDLTTMTPDERAAYQNAQREKEASPTPSPQAAEAMRKQAEDARQRKAMGKAYEDASKDKFKYAKGGYVRSADGIAKRGKTKGRIC